MLSLKEDYTLRFSNFLIIGMSNSSVNCCFDVVSVLITLTEAFSSKIYKPL